jgi:membrane-bound lytic murein transglycosylase D
MVVKMKSVLLLIISLVQAVYVYAGADEIYQNRLQALKSPLEFAYNPSVKPFIEEYLANPEATKELLSRSKQFFPFIEKTLRAKGLPTDLKYLAATVSALNPSAVNSSGSSGLWMMAYPVSKMYKVKVNTYIDERRDPLRSTLVAGQHFKDLYSIYKTWPLAIASYGCSPVTLNKCIHLSNNSFYFWDIYPYMPAFCKELYPRVIATAYIFNYYKEHGISLVEPKQEWETDSILVNKWLSFQQISAVTEVSVDELRLLNPTFRKDVIPFNAEGYFVRIPKSKSKRFEMLRDSVYRPIQASEIQAEPIDKMQTSPSDAPKAAVKPFTKKKVIYTVKKKDNINDIADWYDVSASEIKSWNKLRSTKLNYGRKLIIWVDGAKLGYYKKINKMSPAQKKKIKKKD